MVMCPEECVRAVNLLIKEWGWRQVEDALYMDPNWKLYLEQSALEKSRAKI